MNKYKLQQELNMCTKGCENGVEVSHLFWHLQQENSFNPSVETLYKFTEMYYELKNWIKERFAKTIEKINSIEVKTAKLVVRKTYKEELKQLKRIWKGLEKFEKDFRIMYSVSLSDTQYKMTSMNIKVETNDEDETTLEDVLVDLVGE